MGTEIKKVGTTGAELDAYVKSHTPMQIHQDVMDYCKDVENLTRAMSDLWKEKVIPLSLAGVKVTVKVTGGWLDEPLLQAVLGANADDTEVADTMMEVQHEEK